MWTLRMTNCSAPSVAAALHATALQAVVGGTASSGVIICFLRIITKAALPATRTGLRSSTALYFALSGLLSLSCFVVYHSVLPRLGIVQYYRQKRQEGEAKSTHHAHLQHCLAHDALVAGSCRPVSSLQCQHPRFLLSCCEFWCFDMCACVACSYPGVESSAQFARGRGCPAWTP